METREALKIIMIDILSEPSFVHELETAQMLKTTDPLTPEGKAAKKRLDRNMSITVDMAYRHLFNTTQKFS